VPTAAVSAKQHSAEGLFAVAIEIGTAGGRTKFAELSTTARSRACPASDVRPSQLPSLGSRGDRNRVCLGATRRQRPRRRGPFRRVFPVVSLSDSSIGSPLGRTRSGSTCAPRSATVNVRGAAEEGCDGCGRPTCDAGGCWCGPLLCDGAPSANGTIIVGSSCSVALNDRTDPIVSIGHRPPDASERLPRPSGAGDRVVS
jgi:hypothetical protein